MEAGRALGLVLVKVGAASSPVDHACGSLAAAVDWLLESFSVRGVKEEPDDHRAELLTLLRGAPQMANGSLARELGISEPELHGLLEQLEADGRVVRGEEGRWVVVEAAAAPYEPGEEPF
jgi:hypothetical protein